MSSPYVGEIRMFAGSFAPAGWAMCQGQLIPISENETLFNLIGTTYGGDGQETFGLPDLQGRVPIHAGNNSGNTFTLGERAGVEEITLNINQIPIHNHPMLASSSSGTVNAPNGNVPSSSPSVTLYTQDVTDASLSPKAVNSAGGNQPHTNLQPILCVSFIISLFGIFPSPT